MAQSSQPSYNQNRLKRVQKSAKGFFRGSGTLHHQLKISDLETLLIHPVTGASFEGFVIEEIIREFQCTMTYGLDYYYYRTRDKSESDLIITAPFGTIPIEIKLGHRTTGRSLAALKSFIEDTKAPYGILINNSEKTEQLADRIIQIPAGCF